MYYAITYRNIDVIIGEHDRNDLTDGNVYTVSEYMLHPNYIVGGFDFDFAILTLTNPILVDHPAVPACLPPRTWDGEFLVGKNLTVSG